MAKSPSPTLAAVAQQHPEAASHLLREHLMSGREGGRGILNYLAEEGHRNTPQRSITFLANNEFCYPGAIPAPPACSPAADGAGPPQGPSTAVC